MRQASVIVADDLTFSLNGKWNLFGIYTGDIVIPVNQTPVAQLVFIFVIETDAEDPYKELRLEISIPSGQFVALDLDLGKVAYSSSDNIRWNMRWPLAFYSPLLTPGPILARVLHERGEIIAVAPVISMTSTLSDAAASN